MKITYAPEGADPQTWEIDVRKFMVAELEAIEKHTGLTFIEFGAALANGSPKALRALMWVLQKRQNPPLRYDQVDFAIGDLSFEGDDDEAEEAAPKGEALRLAAGS